MTRKETAEIMNVIQTSYPRFYVNMTSNELKKALDIWTEMFTGDDVNVVKVAVKALINTLEYPPTIADVRKEMAKLMSTVTNEPTGVDEWNEISKAIKDSVYHAQEHFDELPFIAKRFVGTPQQLRDWGMMHDFNESVVRGQFLKQYNELKDREDYKKMLERNPEIAKIMSVKTLGEGIDNEQNEL